MAMLGLAFTVGRPAARADARPDEVILRGEALARVRAGAHELALETLSALHDATGSLYLRSDALELAARSALALERIDLALELAGRIPLPPQSLRARLRILADRKQWREIVVEFAEAPFADWPEALAADAFYLRGTAWRERGERAAALRDFREAARRTDRVEIVFDLAQLASGLQQDVLAMDAFLAVQRAQPSGWRFLRSTFARAGILLRNDLAEFALRELEKAEPGATGYWRVSLLRIRGDALAALGRSDDAVATYHAALETDGIAQVQREQIKAALTDLTAAATPR